MPAIFSRKKGQKYEISAKAIQGNLELSIHFGVKCML
jgi:hypothetical protein